jgi:alginate O-acetyltransferase complex protein AlgI
MRKRGEKRYMLFNSYIFVLLFLPLCLIGWFLLNSFGLYKVSSVFLLGMSLWFYGYFNIQYLPIIIASVLLNYTVHLLFSNVKKDTVRKLLLIVSVLFNLGALFYFKYYDFFFENVNALFGTSVVLKNLLLPLGISFFTFQQLSFVIDSYRGEVDQYSLLDYALFVTYFPQLIAGPIVTHDELIPQLTDKAKRVINWDNFSKGLFLFVLGLSKKVILADTFGNAANWGFSNIDNLNSVSAMLSALSYTIQIYFDFSGYCDMATGVAKMMNIDLPWNFNSPYKSLTITEFWERWHMTLTRFFTRYIYIPLGGNRKGKFRMYLNTLIVFLISGLWHGANWTFVLWGGLHGVFVVITKAFKKFFNKLHPALNWIITFNFVNDAWIFFRADSISDAFQILRCIAHMDFGAIPYDFTQYFALPEFEFFFNKILRFNLLGHYEYAYLVIFLLIAFWLILGVPNALESTNKFSPSLSKSFVIVFLLVWCIFSFSGVSTFLYFNF